MKHVKFDVNTQGRDFVIGDLHGSLDLLNTGLMHLGFDHITDRVFSVGDLVDRGPKSFECLKLLDKPWFHPVKANHEQLMEDFLTDGPTGSWWMMNGGTWWNLLSKEEVNITVDHFLLKIQKLPWMITVELPDEKRFHVIHAEIMGEEDEVITDADLFNEEKFLDIASRMSADGHGFLWGRDIFRELFAKILTKHGLALHVSILGKNHVTDFFNDELSHIFSGHTPVAHPTTILGQTNLDTMSFATGKRSWAGLTITEPLTGKFWKVNEEGVSETINVKYG